MGPALKARQHKRNFHYAAVFKDKPRAQSAIGRRRVKKRKNDIKRPQTADCASRPPPRPKPSYPERPRSRPASWETLQTSNKLKRGKYMDENIRILSRLEKILQNKLHNKDKEIFLVNSSDWDTTEEILERLTKQMTDCPLKTELMKIIQSYDTIYKHLIETCAKDRKSTVKK